MVLVRLLMLLVFGVLMIGFGLCGAFGVFAGVSALPSGVGALVALVPGLAGLGIAWGCWKVVGHSLSGLSGNAGPTHDFPPDPPATAPQPPGPPRQP